MKGGQGGGELTCIGVVYRRDGGGEKTEASADVCRCYWSLAWENPGA